MSTPVVLDSVVDWLRLLNLVLALICAVGIWTVPESPWRNDAAGGARLLSLALGGTYVWSAVNSFIATLIRADPAVPVPDYAIRVYGLLFWLVLTLIALAQRHIIGTSARPEERHEQQ